MPSIDHVPEDDADFRPDEDQIRAEECKINWDMTSSGLIGWYPINEMVDYHFWRSEHDRSSISKIYARLMSSLIRKGDPRVILKTLQDDVAALEYIDIDMHGRREPPFSLRRNLWLGNHSVHKKTNTYSYSR